MSLSFSVKNEDKLFEITKQLAPTLKNQKIIFIEGSVGAGKTTFIRYLLETLAKKDQKKFFFQGSPTYQRENQYYFNELNCVHFDFYQVEDSPHIDLEDYIVDHCLLIEWPLNTLKKIYQQEALFIKIKMEKNYRTIEIQSKNKQWLHQIQ